MNKTSEIVDRERPGVADHKTRLDQLKEAAREYERVKKAKARNTWEKREQAYGTSEEIQKASRILEASLQHARNQISERDIQQGIRDGHIDKQELGRLRAGGDHRNGRGTNSLDRE